MDFAEFTEAFCAGYNACGAGLSESPERFLAVLTGAWRDSGGERARRAVQAAQEPGERDAEDWG